MINNMRITIGNAFTICPKFNHKESINRDHQIYVSPRINLAKTIINGVVNKYCEIRADFSQTISNNEIFQRIYKAGP